MNNSLILKKLKIKNFRCFKDKEFSFDENVILLTGKNGLGKTTIFDAIEWCFTGNIRHLYDSFIERNNTLEEQRLKMNLNGILKNKDLLKADISVEITAIYLNNEILIKRTQKNDQLNGISNFEISNFKEKEELKTLLKNFYENNICDSNKEYRLMTAPRKNIFELLKDFIPEISIPNKINDNFIEIQNKILEKIKQEKQALQFKLDEKSKLITKKNIFHYPKDKVFEEEIIELSDLSLEDLKKQKNKLKNIILNKIILELSSLSNLIENNKKVNDIKLLLNDIDNNLIIPNLSIPLETLIEKQQLLSRVEDFTNTNLSKEERLLLRKIITFRNLKNKYSQMQQELDSGNGIINLFTSITLNRDILIEYQSQNNDCPLCGSDKFKTISKEEIGLLATQYITKHNNDYLEITNTLKKIDTRLSILNNSLKDKLNLLNKSINFIEKNKETLTNIRNLNLNNPTLEKLKLKLDELSLKNEADNYITQVKKMMDEIDINYFANELETTVGINRLLSKLRTEFSGDFFLNLDFIKFELLSNKYTAIKEEILDLERNYTKLEIQDIQKKIKKLDTLLKENQLNLDNPIFDKLNLYLKNKNEYNKEIDYYNGLNNQYNQENLEKLENPINSLFFKLIKETSLTKIKIDHSLRSTEGKTAIKTENDINIFNILSQGQMSVFMIAYFLSNFSFKNNKIKICLLDDITRTMDDLNINSFLDILKYGFVKKDRIISQLFINSCNKNLIKLIELKFLSRNIKSQIIDFDKENTIYF